MPVKRLYQVYVYEGSHSEIYETKSRKIAKQVFKRVCARTGQSATLLSGRINAEMRLQAVCGFGGGKAPRKLW